MKALIALVYLVVSLSGPSADVSTKGINFFEGNFREALAAAKKEKKPVFIYLHATWCGQCKKLKKSFKDEAAGEYFNKNFINISVDGETEEGAMLRSLYNVKEYPTLLIVDANSKLQTKTTGYHTPYLLMNFGKRIVPN